ncbi:MAG: carboxypeptidase regulatory-like domain-containing protein, partial [Deltaproteobacteria bacterium]|nr:carboxypeptidase regulatory-like domain-containing protein [Nannocystaceae bacterium]
LERWDVEPPRAGDSRPPDRDVVDLRELAERPIDPPKHWLEIRVVDEDDAPVAGVKVTLVRPDGARERASTDDDGVARWRKLPSGRARVIFDDDAAVFAEVG